MRGEAPCCDDGTEGGIAGWLSLAATPAFGMMAVYNTLFGGQEMICATMPDASPLNGMGLMYVLMSIFHATPWVKLAGRCVLRGWGILLPARHG
jgi:hypothetical protein